jgi:hypothetical protein
MAWSYNPSNLGTDTGAARLNVVRYLVGDTDVNDQQVQDEEVNFALSEVGNNAYFAASYVADTIAAKYSRRVTTKLDGALSAEYSDLADQYRKLSVFLKQQGQRYSGGSLGLSAGGIKVTDVNTTRDDDNRIPASFRMDRFRILSEDYQTDYTEE